jgi:surface polysaccharide O-acyltransferase-like enzyme
MPEHGNEPLLARFREAELPRWIQVPVGIFLGLFTLFCAFATVDMLFLPGKKKSGPSPILAVAVVLILLLACLWVLEKCMRLVTGRKKRGGLLSPTSLRVVAFSLLIIPAAGLFTGYYREMGAVAIFQAVMYVFGFFGLRAVARKREATLDEQSESEQTET